MVAGAVAATLSGSAQALGVAATAPPLVWFHNDVILNQGGMLVASATLAAAGLGALAKGAGPAQRKTLSLLTELFTGAFFAFGLTYTGMVRPTKV